MQSRRSTPSCKRIFTLTDSTKKEMAVVTFHEGDDVEEDAVGMVKRSGVRRPAVDDETDVAASTTKKPRRNDVSDATALAADLLVAREKLPVFQVREVLVDVIPQSLATVVVGETGSGKTTQIPQFLNAHLRSKRVCRQRREAMAAAIDPKTKKPQYSAEDIRISQESWLRRRIAVTQPRRVAAMSIAQRVSQEMGCPTIGGKVGFSIRFHDVTSRDTQIKFMTDGILLRELLISPDLESYSVVIVDEAHERTVRTDILFGLLKKVQQRQLERVKRGEMLMQDVLRIVVMSATLNADRFSQFFDSAPVLYITGRQFPVRVFSASQRVEDYLDAAVVTTLQIHQLEPAGGDILVFLTGQDDIDSAEKIINDAARALAAHHDKILVRPIYASMPTQQQQLVFEPTPPGCRKVVLATNIAETSITIPGIRYVVDTGLSKSRWYDPSKKIDALTVKPISKAAADQRAGRAGREAAGQCYRLYTADAYERLANETEPEILRCNLESVVLLLKSLGIDDILGFPYIDRPSRESLTKALEELRMLGALESSGKLTEIGRKMTCFPIEPVFARVLLASQTYKCTKELLTLIATLSVENVFVIPHDKREEAEQARRKFRSFDGDHMTLINVFDAYQGKSWASENYVNNRAILQAREIRKQLEGVAIQQGLDVKVSCLADRDTASSEPVLRSLLTGFARSIAVLQPDNTYSVLYERQEAHIHPASTVFRRKKQPDVLVFTELVRTTKNYMRCVSVVRPDWVKDAIKGPT